jgi:alkanesulfonate monooxygenase SsuD/methylene tetrahydromethanopterin reductase-like flavin-dependent oxidoreductase (luciferase family)
MKIGVSMPILNQPYRKFAELARLADSGGFDSVWDYEFFRNPFMIHATCAPSTTGIQHATGIATACSRTPFEMANAAADLDELTGGRTIIGLANGAGMWTDVFNGADISKPLTRIKEYIEVMRLHWKHFTDGEPFSYEGQFYRAASPAFNPWGGRELVRAQIPIFLSVIQPRMLRLAGEIADGALGYLGTPRYFSEIYRPNVAAGATSAGRAPDDVEIAALVICSVSEDRDEAMRRARIQVGNYICFPGADPMVQFEGLGPERDKLLMTLLSESVSAFDAIPDEVVKTFAICGTPNEGREQLDQFRGVLDHIILHTPYVPPLQQRDSEDAFRKTVAALSPATL